MTIGELFNLDKKETKDTGKTNNPPNLRDGKCCGTCVNGSRGYEFVTYCEKYEKWVGVDEICDDWRDG